MSQTRRKRKERGRAEAIAAAQNALNLPEVVEALAGEALAAEREAEYAAQIAEEQESLIAATQETEARPDTEFHLKRVVEGLIFASDKPLTVANLRSYVGNEISRKEIQESLDTLVEEYKDRGIVLHDIAGGYQFRTHAASSEWIQKLIAGRPVRLSRAQLDTLAIIAYRQPITRPEIDDIRGVDSASTVKVLLDRNMVRILGKKEEVGRPLLYGTSKEFLEFFNLAELRDLPTLREFHELNDEGMAQVDKLGADISGVDVGEVAAQVAKEREEEAIAAAKRAEEEAEERRLAKEAAKAAREAEKEAAKWDRNAPLQMPLSAAEEAERAEALAAEASADADGTDPLDGDAASSDTASAPLGDAEREATSSEPSSEPLEAAESADVADGPVDAAPGEAADVAEAQEATAQPANDEAEASSESAVPEGEPLAASEGASADAPPTVTLDVDWSAEEAPSFDDDDDLAFEPFTGGASTDEAAVDDADDAEPRARSFEDVIANYAAPESEPEEDAGDGEVREDTAGEADGSEPAVAEPESRDEEASPEGVALAADEPTSFAESAPLGGVESVSLGSEEFSAVPEPMGSEELSSVPSADADVRAERAELGAEPGSVAIDEPNFGDEPLVNDVFAVQLDEPEAEPVGIEEGGRYSAFGEVEPEPVDTSAQAEAEASAPDDAPQAVNDAWGDEVSEPGVGAADDSESVEGDAESGVDVVPEEAPEAAPVEPEVAAAEPMPDEPGDAWAPADESPEEMARSLEEAQGPAAADAAASEELVEDSTAADALGAEAEPEPAEAWSEPEPGMAPGAFEESHEVASFDTPSAAASTVESAGADEPAHMAPENVEAEPPGEFVATEHAEASPVEAAPSEVPSWSDATGDSATVLDSVESAAGVSDVAEPVAHEQAFDEPVAPEPAFDEATTEEPVPVSAEVSVAVAPDAVAPVEVDPPTEADVPADDEPDVAEADTVPLAAGSVDVALPDGAASADEGWQAEDDVVAPWASAPSSTPEPEPEPQPEAAEVPAPAWEPAEASDYEDTKLDVQAAPEPADGFDDEDVANATAPEASSDEGEAVDFGSTAGVSLVESEPAPESAFAPAEERDDSATQGEAVRHSDEASEVASDQEDP